MYIFVDTIMFIAALGSFYISGQFVYMLENDDYMNAREFEELADAIFITAAGFLFLILGIFIIYSLK